MFQNNHIGKRCYREFHGLDSPCESCSNEIILKQKPKPYYWEHHDPIHDRHFSIIDQIIEWPNGRDVRLEVAIDITDRKKTELKLQRRDRAMETSINGIAFADLDGILTYVNTSFLRLWGFDDADEVIGRSAMDFWKSKESARNVLESVLEGNSWKGELVAQKKDRNSAYMQVSVDAARDHEDRIFCVMGTFVDITEQKKLRASMAQSDRLASMGIMAAGMAHEINNPLTSVFLNLWSVHKQLLELSGMARKEVRTVLDTGTIDELILDLEKSIKGAEYVRNIVKDIKTFTRVDEERLIPVSLNEVIHTAVGLAHNELKYRARLVKELDRIPPVFANDGRLAQVFLNLLLNAVVAMDEQNTASNSIRIRTWSENKEVFAEIRDNGKGIPPEHLDRLFDPFFSTKPIGVGSGLGLSICHNIVTSYGGRIEVESEMGKGTRFVVRLPEKLDEDIKTEPGKSPEQKTEHLSVQGRVLLVDDDPSLRDSLTRILETEHNIVTAASGKECQQILETDKDFDVILCDLMMLEGSGMDLHDWLADRYPNLAQQMVFMTGGVFTSQAEAFLQRVPNLILEKPFEMGVLEKTVRALVVASRN